jgi:hypothetical protein
MPLRVRAQGIAFIVWFCLPLLFIFPAVRAFLFRYFAVVAILHGALFLRLGWTRWQHPETWPEMGFWAYWPRAVWLRRLWSTLSLVDYSEATRGLFEMLAGGWLILWGLVVLIAFH